VTMPPWVGWWDRPWRAGRAWRAVGVSGSRAAQPVRERAGIGGPTPGPDGIPEGVTRPADGPHLASGLGRSRDGVARPLAGPDPVSGPAGVPPVVGGPVGAPALGSEPAGPDPGLLVVDGGVGRPRPGWYAWRPGVGAALPGFAAEVVLTIEYSPPGVAGCRPQALLLCRAASAAPSWLGAAAVVVREVEILAGVRSPGELRLRPPLAVAGMDPVSSTVVMGQLGAAGRRGLVVPWPPECPDGGGTPVWQEGPGAVVRCWNGAEASAQAVVVLHGRGGSQVLGPRPGGAVIVRAWRVGRVWGVVCAVVLGASGALGLGRDAARLAATAVGAGWQASVPRGAEALAVARAGDPREPIPLRAARRAAQDELAALLGVCLQPPAWSFGGSIRCRRR
jgi:hypothetical protein